MSLHKRLILSYFLIIVLCLGITAIAVSALLQRYRDQSMMVSLDNMAQPIYVQIRSLLRGQTTLADVWSVVQEQSQANKVYILFVDDKGKLLLQASPTDNTQNLNVPEGFPHDLTNPTHGTFETASGETLVYSAYPLSRITDPLINRPQTVILCQPRAAAGLIMAGVIRPIIWTGIIALSIALLMAFLMTRSLYSPIQRLSRAAKNIANGHYDEKVEINSPEEIKELAVSFNEMAEKVNQSQQQLRHFVADVSHQLRSPLTSIQGFAQAMVDGTAEDHETRQKAAWIIVDESRRMIRQVNELLELSRMQARQVKMEKEPVDIRELLQHCREIFALRLEEKKIFLKDESDTALIVTGDADRLEDVFCNLLDNAIKNTPQSGKIRISTQEAKDSVNITIADDGPGIPPEQLPHVFERFQPSSGLRTGFGLGLAIAKEIILAHNGRIEVTSQPGQGAQFTVALPAKAKGTLNN